MLSDHNCRLFDVNRFNILNNSLDSSPDLELDKIKNDLSAMAECGFHNFICPVKYNYNLSTPCRKKILCRLKELSAKSVPRGCGKITVSFVPLISLSPETHYIKNISKLTLNNSRYIFIELPFVYSPEYVPMALNRLLYSCNLLPVFVDFQFYARLYPEVELEKIMRIKGAAFQFNIKNAYDPCSIKLIKRILSNGNTVLIGTGSDHDSLNVREIMINIEKFRRKISEKTFLEIILKAKKFPL